MAEFWTLDGCVAMHKYLALLFFVAVFIFTGCVSERDESATRERLLTATPIGSEATNVLKFVVDDLRPKEGVVCYYKYAEALEAQRHVRLDVVLANPGPPAVPMPADWPPQKNWPPHEIHVWMKTYLNGNRLFASWTFDRNDKLLSIDVIRDIGP